MKLEPVVGESGVAVADLLRVIGVQEKHWPVAEVERILSMQGAQFVGVFVGDVCVGATHVAYRHPYPCEGNPFNFVIPQDGRVPCEVTLIGVDRHYRRGASDGGAEVLDALVKGLYRHHRSQGGTHIYSLCEEWTLRILTDGYVGIVGGKVSDGYHYWCGTAVCPGPDCQPTFVCELDMRASEVHWASARPEFWEYLNS